MWLGAAEAVLAGAGRGGVVRVLCWGGGEAQVPAVSSVQAAALLGPAPTTQTRQLGGETVSRNVALLHSVLYKNHFDNNLADKPHFVSF